MIEENRFPVIETDRLNLRQVTKDDAESILAYLSDQDVMKHYGLEPFDSIDDALDEIAWYQAIFEKKTGIRWGITLKEQGRIIGSCGFLNIVSEHRRSEIGFELSKEYWGNGMASEALESVITYGFEQLNLQRVQALIEPPNISSQRLVERKGFIREGLLRNYEFTCGKFDDLLMYSLLKQDYEKMSYST
ncbi:GNAT family N-acetyltransferase [Gracilibacillus caseinilyticus]|uniref:GNAT family N-acetyltransferase n=1 Tax=Gracilibacillus caseinilyticus TaxID=2932256 RepID=A0ABY4EXT9_9BACI|nr:GNAT family protein [Gracilibacillus caseinilyticus]UOQ48785.1 GNAT family N-acetyltransferase [Gracilibacillus caseinilyticus]